MRLRLSVIFAAILLLYACNNNPHCYESVDTLMVTTFTGSTSKKIGSIIVRGYGRNAPGDTLFNNKDSALTKKIGLPLSLTEDSTGFVVYVNNLPSVFWVRHTMNVRLISESCGFAPYYRLDATRFSALIDSTSVHDPVVDPKSIETYSTNGQNLTVYLRLSAN